MSQHQWLYVRETVLGTTEQVGPVTEQELAQLARLGKLRRDTLVTCPTRTQGKWHAVQQVPGLMKQLEAGELERQQAKAEQDAQKAAEKQAAAAVRQAERDQQTHERAQQAQAAAAISDCKDVGLVRTIHDRVRGILTSSEAVELIVVQAKPLINLAPDAIVATNRRLIFYRPKLLGRFEFEDYQWFDLGNAHLKQNMLGSVFSAQHVRGQILTMDYLPKDGAQRLYRLAQEREEQARVARHEMQLNAARAGASQINFGQMPTTPPAAPAFSVQPPAQPGSTGDPMQRLQKLKAMADGGLITPTEYEERKRQILAEV